MINLEDVIRQLAGNAQAVRALVLTIPDEQAQWKPGPELWSLKDVMAHFYNEERSDFRKHLKEMFSDPPQPWGLRRPDEEVKVESCRQALEGFLAEREASIAWLKALPAPDWEITAQPPWGTIRAGDVLASWIEHDFLHIRQINEILYAWTAAQAAPYSVEYAGDW